MHDVPYFGFAYHLINSIMPEAEYQISAVHIVIGDLPDPNGS
jgi:hypothetical protein